MDPRLVSFLGFVAIALMAAAILLLVRDLVINRRQRIAERLRERGVPQELPRLPVGPEAPPAQSLVGRVDQWFTKLENENGTDQPPDSIPWWQLAAGVLLGGLLYLWQASLLVAVIGMILGMAAVTVFFVIARSRRRRKIQDQLPDVMELLARAVRAGETLDQAIALAGETSEEPLKSEFVRCSKHLDMGLSLDAAIRSFTRRAPIPETRIFAATLMVQRRAGGSLPVTLERLARVIRDRLSYQRQFRAATAAAKLSMILILLIGPAVFAYMWFFQRDYVQDFVSTPQGHFMLITAIVLQIVGSLWVFSLLRSDY